MYQMTRAPRGMKREKAKKKESRESRGELKEEEENGGAARLKDVSRCG
jgi:hypothetical protein